MKATLFFDGGCRPTNPGVAAYACIIKREDGKVIQHSNYLGWRTNNYAEYAGLVVGLKLALDNNVDDISIYTDSQLVEGHLNKGWRRNNAELRVMINEAEKLLSKFDRCELTWMRRIYNNEADALCTAIITERRANNPWHKRVV